MIKFDSKDKNPAENSLALVRQVLIALNGAFKKILLYPPEHIIFQNSLNTLKDNLDNFLNQYGDLVFTIDRNKILYQNEVVYEGTMDEESLAFILFRDGIYHLEFHYSIALWEIHKFLEILQTHRVLTEDAENDIVTALWEVDLPCLFYKAEDVGFDTDENFEIPEVGVDESSRDDPDLMADNVDDSLPEIVFQTPVQNRLLWEITPEDQEYINQLLSEEGEEDSERIEYVIYILLYILQQQTQPSDFSEVMAFLNQELQEAMLRHDYQCVYKTLQAFQNNIERHKTRKHWSTSIIKDFFASVSSKRFLNVMQDDWRYIAECTPEELDYLKRLLTMLNSEAIEALAPMLLETTSNQTRELLQVVICVLAERKFEYLDKLLSSAPVELLKMLINVIKFMKSKESFQWLPELLRHESADIRKEALKAIYHRNPDMIGELGLLLYDDDEIVQQLFLNYASQRRDIRTEKLLLDYLKKHHVRTGNGLFISRVYEALGKCGSDESLPFLEKNLFFLPGLRILRSRGSLRRQAAEDALKKINTDKARLLLNKSSKRLHSPE